MYTLTPVKEADITPHPSGRIVVYAKAQPEYQPLPVVRFDDGLVYSEWEIPHEQLVELAEKVIPFGKPLRIRLYQSTFNEALQPVKLELVP